jgi:phosphoglycolate phosphatase
MRAGAQAIRAAIIDLDGTMLHTVPDFELALNAMRADFGLAPITAEIIEPMVGKGSEKLIRDVLALDYDAARIDAVFEDAMAAYQRHYLAINGQRSTLYPDVAEGLRALKALAQKGLAPHFEIVYGGDSLARKKPDPLPLLQVCGDFDLAPAQVVAIGDSSNDAEAARAAGCFVLTVPYGYNHGQSVQTINSDGIVNSLLEAAKWISAYNASLI